MHDVPRQILTPDDRLYDPPLLDMLAWHGTNEPCVLTIVPDDDVGMEEKLTLIVQPDEPDHAHIGNTVAELERLASRSGIKRVVHAGGGDFTLIHGRAAVTLAELADAGADVGAIAQAIKHLAVFGENALRLSRLVTAR